MFLSELVWPTVKLYSFADSLKDVCSHLFGLTTEQLYGSNAEKNTLTKLIWKDMPGLPPKKTVETLKKLGFNLAESWTLDDFMSAREVLQYLGTEIFRKIYNNVWVDATLKNIKRDNSELAVITDCRFPNEVEGVQDSGGVAIRLTRSPFEGQDEHASEVMLNPDVFNWDRFDAVIDNKEMDIQQQNEAIFIELVRLKVLEPEQA